MLIDTHCHVHEPGELTPDGILTRAHQAGVSQMLCVGTDETSSRLAVEFAEKHTEAYAVIGVHPHDTKHGWAEIARLASVGSKVVGVGEIGLDYYYNHSPKEVQQQALREQIAIAQQYNLPISFHVRDAFDDFWPIFDEFPGVRGVLHSFTDSAENLQRALNAGLYIGVNGISTFTKDEAQRALFDSIPLERLLFETDAPFLTPAPYRGKINEPAYVKIIAEFHAARRGISLEEIAEATSRNARALFALS